MAEKRARVSWSLECLDRTFLEACIHEVTNNGWEGSSLKRSSWDAVGEKLKTDHKFIVDFKQMKNRYDYLKQKYAAWLKLKNKTGNIYDPTTNTFSLSNEEWEAEQKLNKYVGKLRNSPLLFPDLCTKLFEGVTSTGINSWGPSSTLPRPTEEVHVNHVDCTNEETQEDRVPASEDTSGQPKRKVGSKARRNAIDDDLREFGKEILGVAKAMVEENNMDKDFDACMEKLEKMEWGEDDPRYATALLLFGESADLRKMWLRLKPLSCELWLKNAGRKFGLFE